MVPAHRGHAGQAHRAGTELRARGIDPDDPDDRVTAPEWLAAQEQEQAEADRYRVVREEHELHDDAQEMNPADLDTDTAQTDVPDAREVWAPDPRERPKREQRRRVPTADETTAAVQQANEARAEVATREAAEEARLAE